MILLALGIKVMACVQIDSKHCRAICDEIGERLRQYIDRDPVALPLKLQNLLRALELSELEAPSLVPSLDEMGDIRQRVPVFAEV